MARFLLLALLLIGTAAPLTRAQSGPRALPSRARPVRQARLDRAIPETSGLQFTDGALWTFNDGGNAPLLFRVDTATGRVLQRVRIRNFPNVDWEDLAADARYFYLGDFGNNYGTRRDLRILRVAKAAIGPAAVDSVLAEEIAFYYPEQVDFSPRLYRHNFDCEAFFYANDSLHLFTKGWADAHTRHYTVPARPGRHAAHLKAAFDTQGLVTAAALSPTGTAAALLGYRKSGTTFLWLLTDFAGSRFLAGTARRLKLPPAWRIGQAEGLCFVGPRRVFMSNERLPNTRVALVRQQLRALDLCRWLAPRAQP